jgi:hypothetical protein
MLSVVGLIRMKPESPQCEILKLKLSVQPSWITVFFKLMYVSKKKPQSPTMVL